MSPTRPKIHQVNGLKTHGANLGRALLDQVSSYRVSHQLCGTGDANMSGFSIGFRVPFYVTSPWTRGNRVFTERADHNSHILFI